MLPKSSRSRTNGERPISGRVGEGGETRSAAVMNIDKAAPTPAARGMSYHRCGEVKARLTIERRLHSRSEQGSAGRLPRRYLFARCCARNGIAKKLRGPSSRR